MQKPCLLRMHTAGSIAQGILCLLGVYFLHIDRPIKVCVHVCVEALILLTKALWSSKDCPRLFPSYAGILFGMISGL